MSDIQEHMRWLRDAGGRTNMEALRAIEALLARTEKAEAEVERLREVLKNIAHFEPDRNSWSVKQARSALEAKP